MPEFTGRYYTGTKIIRHAVPEPMHTPRSHGPLKLLYLSFTMTLLIWTVAAVLVHPMSALPQHIVVNPPEAVVIQDEPYVPDLNDPRIQLRGSRSEIRTTTAPTAPVAPVALELPKIIGPTSLKSTLTPNPTSTTNPTSTPVIRHGKSEPKEVPNHGDDPSGKSAEGSGESRNPEPVLQVSESPSPCATTPSPEAFDRVPETVLPSPQGIGVGQ